MKKIISVLLSVLLLFSCVSLLAFADDGYTQVYTVRVAENCQRMIEIEPVGDTTTVKAGENFRFGVKYLGNYRPDETTVIKYYPASFPHDLYYHDDDTTDMYTLTPDELGIYTIENVDEDMYITVFSLQEKSLSNVKDMLVKFFNAFLAFFKKLLSLGK